MYSTCKECGDSVIPERKHHCPNVNRLLIYCNFCDVLITDFIVYPGYKYPEQPRYLYGRFVCFHCEGKACLELQKLSTD